MKIRGTGIDIVEIGRIRKIYARYAEVFASKILHDQELKELVSVPDKEAFIAKRFVVKEAFVKALGTGICGNVSWRNMYVQHDEYGKPLLAFTPEFAKEIRAHKLDICISIADENEYAVAHVFIIENE